MLSLASDGRYPVLTLTPPQRRQRTLEALITQTEALSRQNPLLMVFEDAQWADPTSLELLGRAIDRIANRRALLLVTFRPEFKAPWIGRPYVTALGINRLAQPDVDAMIDRLVGTKSLPASIRRDIVERTDGIPLFVEEMTKAVLESEGEARRTAAAIPSPALAVPASLHASLMARLDRLGPAKEIARIGAVIGREFSHSLVAAVAGKPEPELASALMRLIAAGLLFSQGAPPHANYLFKHALVQDAAYGTLLREPKRALHVRIAETLESQFAEIAERQPELLARHYNEAGQIEKAASLWAKAGQQSLARSALVEAAEQLRRALDLIATLPGTPELRRTQIKLQVALITPLLHVKGYGAPEAKAAMEQARLLMEQAEALGEPAEDPLLLFSVLYGFWAARIVAFNGDAIRELATQFLALAQKQGATFPLMLGHRIMATTLLSTGDIAQGRGHYDQSLALYEPVEHRAQAMRFGQDARVVILCYRPLALWMLGYPDAALADADQVVKEAREIGHAASLMIALYYAPATYLLCGRYQAASAAINELIALADEKASVQWKGAGMFVRSWLVALTGTAADAVPAITAGLTAYRSTGATAWIPSYLSYLAKAYAELGQFDEAWRYSRRSNNRDRNNQGNVVGSRYPSPGRGNRAHVAAAGCGESAGLFRAGARSSARPAGEILGAAGGDEHRPALPRPGQAPAGPRSPRAGLWLVQRRLRHARSEGSQGLARRAVRMRFSKFRTLGLALVRSRIGRDRPNLPTVELLGRLPAAILRNLCARLTTTTVPAPTRRVPPQRRLEHFRARHCADPSPL